MQMQWWLANIKLRHSVYRGEVDSKTCFLKTEGSECAFYKLLGAILRLFSRLSKLFIALLSRKRAAKRRHRDSRFKQSFAFRSLCFRRCCLYAANSGTEQLAVHVYHATLLPQRSNKLRSFSSFAANNNSRSYSAVFQEITSAVINHCKSNSSPTAKPGTVKN